MIIADRRVTLVLSTLLVLSLSSCIPPGHGTRPVPGGSSAARPRVDVFSLEHRIHDIINRERLKQGLRALAWDTSLAGIARRHSIDMGARKYFSHSSPEGHDFSFRYRSAGYTCSIRTGNTYHLGAENIFQNNRYDSVTFVNGQASFDWNSEEKIAETTVRGWMNSPGHRKNILTPYWEREGIGIAVAPDDKVYITQNFC
jgi:uncharacterized protein YkwD